MKTARGRSIWSMLKLRCRPSDTPFVHHFDTYSRSESKYDSRELFTRFEGIPKTIDISRLYQSVYKHRDHWQSLYNVCSLLFPHCKGESGTRLARYAFSTGPLSDYLKARAPADDASSRCVASRRVATPTAQGCGARERGFRPAARRSYPRKSKEAGLSAMRARVESIPFQRTRFSIRIII